MRIPFLAAIALAAAIPAAAPAARDPQFYRVPAATPIGAPVDCLPTHRLREMLVRSDRVIDFVVAGRGVFRNTLDATCPNLGFERRFAYEASSGELCAIDTITVIQPRVAGRGPRCGLGRFQPVRLAR